MRPTHGFEEAGLDLLWPWLEARLKKGGDGPAGERPYECWSYDYTGSGRLNIHIDNVYTPGSPLSEMFTPFAASLIRMLLDSLERCPEVTVVRCSSWMNSTPRFRSLFPPRWVKSEVVNPHVGYTMGHWGQFMDRRGDFHVRERSTVSRHRDIAVRGLKLRMRNQRSAGSSDTPVSGGGRVQPATGC